MWCLMSFASVKRLLTGRSESIPSVCAGERLVGLTAGYTYSQRGGETGYRSKVWPGGTDHEKAVTSIVCIPPDR